MEPKCRVCLSSSSSASLSALSQTNIFMLKSIYSSFTVLNATDIENLRDLKAYNNICSFCQTVLSLLYEFQQKVVRSERELLQQISSTEQNSKTTLPGVGLFDQTEFSGGDGGGLIDENYSESTYRPELDDDENDYDTADPLNSVFVKTEPNINDFEVLEAPPNVSTGSEQPQRKRRRVDRRIDPKSKRFKSGTFYKANVAQHLTCINDELKKYSCNLCGKILLKKVYALQHVHYEHLASQTNLYRCEHCSYSTPKKFNLTVHMAKHQRDGDIVATEPAPPPDLKSEQPLKEVPGSTRGLRKSDYTISEGGVNIKWLEHLTETQLGSGVRYTCTFCSKDFCNKRNGIDHVRETHFRNLITNYNCTKCSFSTPRKFNLSIHLKKHERELKQRNSVVDQRQTMNEPVIESESEDASTEVMEEDNKLLKKFINCETCLKTFRKQEHYERHFSLELCDVTFDNSLSSNSVKQLLNSIPGGKMMSCKLCDEEFRDSGSGVRHARKVHLRNFLKPFNCQDCTYTSVRKENFVGHLTGFHAYNSAQVEDVLAVVLAERDKTN